MRTTGKHVTDWLLEGSTNGNSGYSQSNEKITRSLPHQVAEVVQRPLDSAIAVTTSTASRARSPRIAAAAPHLQRFGQVLNTSNSLGTIGSVFSRSRHGHPPW